MKKKLLNFFIIIIFFSALPEKAYSQSDEFPIGAYLMGRPDKPATPPLYNNYYSIKEAGLNTVFQYCIPVNDPLYNSNKDSLMQFESVIPFNGFKQNDYVHHYSAGMYSKWEAENDQTDQSKIGIKHAFGRDTNYLSVQCWYSDTNSTNINDSLVYGPHYLQYKKYPLYYNGGAIRYILKVRMIKANPTQGNQNVCKIMVLDEKSDTLVVRYVNENELETEWNQNSIIDTTYLHTTSTEEYSPTDPYYKLMDLDESKSDKITGVQYKIEWLTNIPVYIDYIEVYDDFIWKEYLDRRDDVEDSILAVTSKFSDWNNIKYWNSLDEPLLIDQIEPNRILKNLITKKYSEVISAAESKRGQKHCGGITSNQTKYIIAP